MKKFYNLGARSAPQAAKETTYKTFIGLLAEYASTSWAPLTDSDIKKIEMDSEGQQDLCAMIINAQVASAK